jgi:hypothetical protein
MSTHHSEKIGTQGKERGGDIAKQKDQSVAKGKAKLKKHSALRVYTSQFTKLENYILGSHHYKCQSRCRTGIGPGGQRADSEWTAHDRSGRQYLRFPSDSFVQRKRRVRGKTVQAYDSIEFSRTPADLI